MNQVEKWYWAWDELERKTGKAIDRFAKAVFCAFVLIVIILLTLIL